MKAERKAKENAKDFKKKFPTGFNSSLKVTSLGTVTIVFSDVQSSTAQWELYPDAMSEAMEVHNSTIREKILLTGGYEVKTGEDSAKSDLLEGDSFMVAFPSAVSAVWFCLFVQEALLHAKWPSIEFLRQK